MHSNFSKSMEKIYIKFSTLEKLPKAILKYGLLAFMALLSTGTLLLLINRFMTGYTPYLEFIATNIVKSSFSILLEVVLGAIIMDFVFNKN